MSFFVSVFRVHNIIYYSFQAGRVVRSVLKEKRIIQSFVSFKSRKCHQEFTAAEREILFENKGWLGKRTSLDHGKEI